MHGGEDFASADLRYDARVQRPQAAAPCRRRLRRCAAASRRIGALIGFDRRRPRPSRRSAPASAKPAASLLEPAALALENAMLLKRAEALSVTDDLTRLYNSRYLNLSLRRETKRAVAHRPPAVAAVHRPRRLQGRQRHLRPPVWQPRAGRSGGRHPRQRARNRRRRPLRRRRVRGDPAGHRRARARSRWPSAFATGLRRTGFSTADRLDVRLTASVGIATLPDVAASAEELVQAADTAMYKVKMSGKNGISRTAPPMTELTVGGAQGVRSLALRSLVLPRSRAISPSTSARPTPASTPAARASSSTSRRSSPSTR